MTLPSQPGVSKKMKQPKRNNYKQLRSAFLVLQTVFQCRGIITAACHHFVDRPAKSLFHQSAGHQKCCMKPLQPFFLAVAGVSATRRSSLLHLTVTRLSPGVFRVPSSRISQQKWTARSLKTSRRHEY